MSRLDKLAEEIARREGSASIRPVIEKELLHYEILAAVSRAGFSEAVTFQGGTSLRLCYGSSRYSEDLDFAGGPDFSWHDFETLGKAIERRIASAYDVTVRVRQPRDEDSLTARWQIVVDTSPERPDLPRQRIKLEVGRVPAHTSTPRNLILNYDELSSGYADIIMRVESREEIVADKIVSFYDSSYTRYRDLWDLNWLYVTSRLDLGAVSDLVALKCEDYAMDVDPHELITASGRRMAQALPDPAFVEQMGRFLPPETIRKSVGWPGYLEAMGENLAELVAETASGLRHSVPLKTDDPSFLPHPTRLNPSAEATSRGARWAPSGGIRPRRP